jgi:hypothetical protein
MRQSIPGVLDMDALRRLHFNVLSQDEQKQAIRRLAASGQGPNTVAQATGWTLEEVLRVLSEVQP